MIKILTALSNKERKSLGIKEKNVFWAEWKGKTLIVVRGVPLYFFINGRLIPTLHGPWQGLPKVFVDSGAAAHILKGADVLRPGIVKMENFAQGEGVVIMLENSVLGIGIALLSSEEAKKLEKGKIIKTIHVKGDEIWKMV